MDRRQIIELAARHRLPAMYQWREPVDEGGLVAYGSSITELARRTDGRTGADIESLCKKAMLVAIDRCHGQRSDKRLEVRWNDFIAPNEEAKDPS